MSSDCRLSTPGLLDLIPIALLLGFLWAVRTGQFDDLDGAAERILFDDDDEAPAEGSEAKKEEGRE